MRRFFIEGAVGPKMVITGKDAHHITRVLRYAVGQTLIVVDAEKNIAEAEIAECSEGLVKLRLVGFRDENTEPPIEITLAQCLPKSDKMDFIVQKAVELGVSRICPVVSKNCVVKYDAAKRDARKKKWQKIADEAAKQCGRTALPQVEPILELGELIARVEPDALALLCYEGQADADIKSLLEGAAAKKFLLLIGPEGGFAPSEVALCKAAGAKAVTMGPRILRTETAALAAVSVVMYQNGDLDGRSG